LEAARLYDLLEDPRVIASGGGGGGGVSRGGGVPESRAMRRALVELGVPDDRILEESSSTDTRQEALNIRSGFVDQVEGSFVLVTSPTHMRRAMGAFRAVGLQPIASPSGEIPAASPAGLRRLLPSLDSLSASTFTIREYMALGYYALRGWTKAR
jgi:uncharacterized SAM-binding protein YcdF (DUF218 family)